MEQLSLTQLFGKNCREYPNRIAFRFENRSWTYSQLNHDTNVVASGLNSRGIRRGDRVAFLLPNSPELVFLNLACLTLGAIAVPMNVRLKGAELAYILNHCRARLGFIHGDLYSQIESVRSELSEIETLFSVAAKAPIAGCVAFEDWGTASNAVTDWADLDEDDVAAILYTSGTTARPKGVTHTHRTLRSTVRNFVATIGLMPDDVVFGMLSMSHIFGYTLQLLSPLSVGATVVAAPGFDPDHVFNVISAHHVSHLFGLPVMFDTLTRKPLESTANVQSLRYCLAGGDAVSQRLNASVYSVLGVELYEGCGMTEVIPYALNRPGIENRVGSIGIPSGGVALRLVDEQGQDIPSGDIGEILVQSDGVTIGYWEDSESTAVALRDGWFHTGDLGRRDIDGYYWFVGRSKEIIVRGGSNISPLEVEAALSRHPAVHEVAVVGLPHPTYGETVAAFVILKSGTTTTDSELLQFAALKIADYKLPERITFLDELPRGLTGKIQRKALKELVVP